MAADIDDCLYFRGERYRLRELVEEVHRLRSRVKELESEVDGLRAEVEDSERRAEIADAQALEVRRRAEDRLRAAELERMDREVEAEQRETKLKRALASCGCSRYGGRF